MTEETRRWKKKSSEPISNWPFVRESCEWEEVIRSVPRETVAGARGRLPRFGSTGHDYLRERMLNFKQRRGASFSREEVAIGANKEFLSLSFASPCTGRVASLENWQRYSVEYLWNERGNREKKERKEERRKEGRKGDKRSGDGSGEGEAVIYSINRA